MSLFDQAKEQSNVLDGTIFALQVFPGEGAYVTIAGRDEQVYICAFGMDDLAHLAQMNTEANGGAA